ncbi:hypothetical protein [Paratractidigestivibacter faecalis]|uniref:Uncharacterized protein n=1 Tax=Paratractidigestivibacter faecalis TaxID=2292441 RepID=A0ABV1II53_9ACTN
MEIKDEVVPMQDEEQSKGQLCEEAQKKEQKPFVIDRAKNALAVGKERVIEFWDGNKHWIAPVVGIAVTAAAAVTKQAIDNGNLREENERLSGDNDFLRLENEALNDENDHLTDMFLDSCERHAEKDAWMDAMASDDLRRGGSLGGQVLRSKRDYLQEQNES